MAPEKKASTRSPGGFALNEHPIIIASGSATAGFLLCLAIFTQVVVPSQMGKLEIETLRNKDALATARAERAADANMLEELFQRLDVLRTSNESLQQELLEARAANLFSPGNPYPNSLGLVRIGMPAEEISRIYVGHEINSGDDPDIVVVTLKNSPFERVVYYLSRERNGLISHVSFDFPLFDSQYSEDFVYRKLIETFGEPKEKRRNRFMWHVGDDHSLFVHRKDGYVLMRRGQQPVFWGM